MSSPKSEEESSLQRAKGKGTVRVCSDIDSLVYVGFDGKDVKKLVKAGIKTYDILKMQTKKNLMEITGFSEVEVNIMLEVATKLTPAVSDITDDLLEVSTDNKKDKTSVERVAELAATLVDKPPPEGTEFDFSEIRSFVLCMRDSLNMPESNEEIKDEIFYKEEAPPVQIIEEEVKVLEDEVEKAEGEMIKPEG